MEWHDKASEQHQKSEETRYLLHGTKKETHPTHPVTTVESANDDQIHSVTDDEMGPHHQ